MVRRLHCSNIHIIESHLYVLLSPSLSFVPFLKKSAPELRATDVLVIFRLII